MDYKIIQDKSWDSLVFQVFYVLLFLCNSIFCVNCLFRVLKTYVSHICRVLFMLTPWFDVSGVAGSFGTAVHSGKNIPDCPFPERELVPEYGTYLN